MCDQNVDAVVQRSVHPTPLVKAVAGYGTDYLRVLLLTATTTNPKKQKVDITYFVPRMATDGSSSGIHRKSSASPTQKASALVSLPQDVVLLLDGPLLFLPKMCSFLPSL